MRTHKDTGQVLCVCECVFSIFKVYSYVDEGENNNKA